ncbi:MAG: hypothetical protein K2G88_05150 [Oscillospiraceae bacterium]|nr:hypothetical protein [Oscillospiraceae bacterium]
MEILVIAVIIIVLLLILGVNPMNIIFGVVGLIELFFIFMMLFFIISLVLLLMTKKTKGEFLRIEDNKKIGVGTHAVYKINQQEYNNTFPAEIMFVEKIYKTNKQVNIWQYKGKKLNLVFDFYSILVIAFGLPVFTGLAIALAILIQVFLPYVII